MKKSRLTKTIMSIALCFMLCVSVFAGCALVTKDMGKYYNAVVASYTYKETGEKVNVTKKELITAFNSYGYQYLQYTDKKGKEAYEFAYKETLDQVINQKLTIRSIEEELKRQNNGEALTTKEKTYLWEKTCETIEDNIIDYYNDINNIPDDADKEDSTDGVVTEKVYERTATLEKDENNKFFISLKEKSKTEVEEHVFWNGADRDLNKKEDVDVLYDYVLTFVKEHPIYSKAYNRYLADAKKSEEGQNLSTENSDIFKREINRIGKVLYDSFMITKYKEFHQSNNSNVALDSVMRLYENKVIKDYTKYVSEESSTYEEDILTDSSKINYYKPGTQFFYVSHILAKFDETEQATYDECMKIINGEKDGDLTIGEAQAKVEELYKNLSFPVREKNDKGEWVDTNETKSVEAVLAEVKLKLETAGDDEYLRAEYFNEFIYKYNQDDGVFNSTENYVMGIDYSKPDEEKGTSYTIHSKMVEPFTNAGIELFKNNAEIGQLYLPNENDLSSGLIHTQYGIHIMVYEGKVTNLFGDAIDENFKLTYADLEKLVSKEARIKAGEDKTEFDLLFDALNNNPFTVFESMNLQFLRDAVSIEYYPDEYKDLTKV